MRQLTFIYLTLALFSAGAQAAPISVGNINDIYVANQVIDYSNSAACEPSQTQATCDFLTPNPKPEPPTYLDNAALASIVTSDAGTYIMSPYRDSASIDLGFNGYNIYNGAGNDLVIFIVGNTTSFGLEVFDKSGDPLPFFSDTYSVATPTFSEDLQTVLDKGDTVLDSSGNWLCANGKDDFCTDGAALSAIFIDLGDSIAGDVALGSLRILMGEDYNGTNPLTGQPVRPRFSLAGGFYTQPTVVPLPLPAVLFSSGLALLAWVGRRKSL